MKQLLTFFMITATSWTFASNTSCTLTCPSGFEMQELGPLTYSCSKPAVSTRVRCPESARAVWELQINKNGITDVCVKPINGKAGYIEREAKCPKNATYSATPGQDRCLIPGKSKKPRCI